MTTVSLVLGSGGARGYAHIGAIEEIERRGYKIVSISGSSMGALVGGMYAAGKLPEYRDWVLTLNWVRVVRLLDFTLSRGAIRGDKVFIQLAELLGSPNIEDLDIDYTAVAADIAHQKEVWYQKGSLLEAIRASVAVPGLFTPVIKEGRVLVDGGVLNPLPIIPAVAAQADLIIAVDLNTGDSSHSHLKLPSNKYLKRSGMSDEWHMPDVEREQSEEDEEIKASIGGRMDILLNSVEVMQASLAEYKIAGYPPDLIVRIPKDLSSFYDFHRAAESIEYGRLATRDKLEALENGEPIN
ncbi:patatin-like phospholipase family protein [Neptuniibacter sp.]|uniref:patatin-like phospholipase family protein n=1 Tax=Neptuniibacter sp. TaxID=1962643 RepID=UPI00261D3741|nr:patatin-like phospholipase family protein [Neptuniibacter sp.]MCP4598217.1 alpha/beta hydrolase [Neptuniibacter sp.]